MQGLPYNETAINGNQANFACIGESIPAPHVEWLKDNKPLNNTNVRTSGNLERTSRLTISAVKYKDRGEYTCVFRNYRGDASSKVHLVVYGRFIMSKIC